MFNSRFGAFVFPDLNEAIHRVLVLGRLETLHAGFHDVDRRVAENGGRAGKRAESAYHRLGNRLLWIASAVPVLARFHDEEPDRLVGALLEYGSCEALVRSTDS